MCVKMRLKKLSLVKRAGLWTHIGRNIKSESHSEATFETTTSLYTWWFIMVVHNAPETCFYKTKLTLELLLFISRCDFYCDHNINQHTSSHQPLLHVLPSTKVFRRNKQSSSKKKKKDNLRTPQPTAVSIQIMRAPRVQFIRYGIFCSAGETPRPNKARPGLAARRWRPTTCPHMVST